LHVCPASLLEQSCLAAKNLNHRDDQKQQEENLASVEFDFGRICNFAEPAQGRPLAKLQFDA
jgi:hypothetical protein